MSGYRARRSSSTSSPAVSHASDSSFSELAIRSSDKHSDAFDAASSDDLDEVVWTGNELDSGDEFILVPQCRPVAAAVTDSLSRLSLSEPLTPTAPKAVVSTHSPKPKHATRKPVGRRRGRLTESAPTIPASTAPKTPPGASRGRPRRRKRDATSYPSPSPSPSRAARTTKGAVRETGDKKFGEHLVVESDNDEPATRRYEDAVRYITSSLASPTAFSSRVHLTFLQSLIIELGLVAPTSVLPSTLGAAKRFIKSHAFVNINVYLSVRGQGVEQIRSAMYSSRSELASDLRQRRGARKANKQWVKQHGLSVLLVTVF